MLLPLKRIPEGHSDLSQSVTFDAEETGWLGVQNLVCRAAIDRLGSDLYIHIFYTGAVFVECSRCLTKIEYPIGGDFRIICKHSAAKDTVDSEEDCVDLFFDDTTEELDVKSLVYEELVLSIPMKPLCSETCSGGVIEIVAEEKDSVSKSQGNHTAPIDPRWEALKKLQQKNENK